MFATPNVREALDLRSFRHQATDVSARNQKQISTETPSYASKRLGLSRAQDGALRSSDTTDATGITQSGAFDGDDHRRSRRLVPGLLVRPAVGPRGGVLDRRRLDYRPSVRGGVMPGNVNSHGQRRVRPCPAGMPHTAAAAIGSGSRRRTTDTTRPDPAAPPPRTTSSARHAAHRTAATSSRRRTLERIGRRTRPLTRDTFAVQITANGQPA
jgi:hypothetical protein